MQTLFSDESLFMVFALAFLLLSRAAWSASRARHFSLAYFYLFPVGVFVCFYFYLACIPGLTTAPGESLTGIVRPALVLLVMLVAFQFNRDWIATQWEKILVPTIARLQARLNLFRKKLQ